MSWDNWLAGFLMGFGFGGALGVIIMDVIRRVQRKGGESP
jgi:hypothetical protein